VEDEGVRAVSCESVFLIDAEMRHGQAPLDDFPGQRPAYRDGAQAMAAHAEREHPPASLDMCSPSERLGDSRDVERRLATEENPERSGFGHLRRRA
jgi:hypothetical protein